MWIEGGNIKIEENRSAARDSLDPEFDLEWKPDTAAMTGAQLRK